MAFLHQDLEHVIDADSIFESVAGLTGETYRDVSNRRTMRFETGGHGYFAKVHFGVGWREIFKELSQLRMPVLGADRELKAITKLSDLGVATMTPVAFDFRGFNPASIRSCIVTRELSNTTSVEDLVLSGSLTLGLKRFLIREIASIAKTMHDNGFNHRDFYICHFLVELPDEPSPRVFLIDLHRAQLRQATPYRWIVKDVGGLFFSVFEAGLTDRDILRFMVIYRGRNLRQTLTQDKQFWRDVFIRAAKLYRQDHRDIPAQVKRLQRALFK